MDPYPFDSVNIISSPDLMKIYVIDKVSNDLLDTVELELNQNLNSVLFQLCDEFGTPRRNGDYIKVRNCIYEIIEGVDNLFSGPVLLREADLPVDQRTLLTHLQVQSSPKAVTGIGISDIFDPDPSKVEYFNQSLVKAYVDINGEMQERDVYYVVARPNSATLTMPDQTMVPCKVIETFFVTY